ncbi:ovarian cancer-associated 2 protein-like protein [Moniliophthora roreri MCA 2997]|uniref:Ovarian cancer-associated 2 protein-like protein n=2 Tax=Moniliophthora roreri TaxID=221103 RepID=V2WQV9_MONRO|nr:ovarian cancer-associated 2 protein-like protein [Moniliophthora roreri MCA 2997]
MPTKKVLVLHGYSQNANIFSKRLAALRKQCRGVEMIFLDAPHVLQPVDLFGDTPESFDGASDPASDPTLTPRGWWKFADSAKAKYVGIEATLDLIRDTLKTTRFDGVFGFSQGAALATLIAALLERPHLYPPFLVDGHSLHPPFQYCVSVAGFKARDPVGDTILSPGFSTPTLHILGKTDIIVTGERAKTILDLTINKRVEEHEGGHFVPLKANWRKFLSEYLREGPTANIPSPSAIPVSAPTSGAARPVSAEDQAPVVSPPV